jgi:hypothetical protein
MDGVASVTDIDAVIFVNFHLTISIKRVFFFKKKVLKKIIFNWLKRIMKLRWRISRLPNVKEKQRTIIEEQSSPAEYQLSTALEHL